MSQPKDWTNWMRWICSWADFIEGLFGILTLGLIKTTWAYQISLLIMKYNHKYRMEE